MEQSETNGQPEGGPNYYYDASKRAILLGEVALGSSQIHNLADLLEGEESDFPEVSTSEINDWTRTEILNNGRIVGGTVQRINEQVLHRAYRLGILPSRRQISIQFGSTSKFYRELGNANTHRIALFDDWTQEKFLRYIQEIAEQTGKKPTWDLLDSLARGSTEHPSPYVITARMNIKTFRGVLELAGYPDITSWTEEDYIQWGVKFMRANGGNAPNEPDFNFLSRYSRGPAGITVRDHFGKINIYKGLVTEAYVIYEEERSREREEKIAEIEECLASGKLNRQLFEGIESEDEMIVRYARYVVIDKLLSDNHATSKLSIATMSNETVRADGFVGSVRKINNAISAGDIESTALYLNVFDDLWPQSDEYMKLLRIVKYKRGRKLVRRRLVKFPSRTHQIAA